ncbi:carbohydrate-binding protein [Labedella phragmitis]|uniref:Carbohydrate-binding protein n=1 Tax=Labedella phragmitis TaxID=2498849 RepID=A0A3S3Z5Q4_9MICO|nr:CBM35 domain-containing protein [Labedella phragmitis]RWZ52393.1 carbohydrate-binding protein [Labedella phragmitis]
MSQSSLPPEPTARGWPSLTSSGTFLREGIDDTGGFKPILTRNIRHLIDEAGQTQYEQVLTDNATQAANHVNSSGVGGYDWTAPTPELSSAALQSLAAGATVAILQQAAPDGYTGVVEGSGVYEAENAVRNGVDSESTAAGRSGRGYLAGWNTSGTSVTFHVNVVDAGTYPVELRYAAGAGNAVRSVSVNGGSATSVAFPGTAAWDAWSTVSTTAVLQPGHNTITVAYGPGDANFLNLDRLALTL